MSDETVVPPHVIASAQTPFIYFETTPFFGLVNGIGKVALGVSCQIAVAPDGDVLFDHALVAYLVGNLEAIKRFRSALDGILLLAEPASEGPAN